MLHVEDGKRLEGGREELLLTLTISPMGRPFARLPRMAKTTTPAKTEVRELHRPTMKASLWGNVPKYDSKLSKPVTVVVEVVVAGEGKLAAVTDGEGEEYL